MNQLVTYNIYLNFIPQLDLPYPSGNLTLREQIQWWEPFSFILYTAIEYEIIK